MSKFIELTLTDGKKRLFNPDYIVYVKPSDEAGKVKTIITLASTATTAHDNVAVLEDYKAVKVLLTS